MKNAVDEIGQAALVAFAEYEAPNAETIQYIATDNVALMALLYAALGELRKIRAILERKADEDDRPAL